MKNIYCFLLLSISLTSYFNNANAQNDTSTPVKVAVFVPLYIDAVADSLISSSEKYNLPRNVLPGLEFYNGVMMAIDSLQQEHAKVEISIYDTKQTSKSLNDLLKTPELNNVGLIIAVITNTAELKTFAAQTLTNNIPFISATYPNANGVIQNSNFVLLNSTFQTHLEGLYKYMQRFYATNTIIAVTKKGATENYIKNYITNINKAGTSTPVKIRWVSMDSYNSGTANLIKSLDSTKNNVVFVASPLESFGLNIVRTLSSQDSYTTTAIGMPTWDAIKDLDKPDCENVEIIFSTPFLFYSQNLSLSAIVNKRYKEKYFSRPSDMVFKGFETTYHFTKLLDKYKSNLANNLTDTAFTLFNSFKLEPVKVRKTSIKPDFLENKKLYFIKKQQGSVKSVI